MVRLCIFWEIFTQSLKLRPRYETNKMASTPLTVRRTIQSENWIEVKWITDANTSGRV